MLTSWHNLTINHELYTQIPRLSQHPVVWRSDFVAAFGWGCFQPRCALRENPRLNARMAVPKWSGVAGRQAKADASPAQSDIQSNCIHPSQL